MTPAEFAVYGWMPYLERMRRIALGAAYWLALWDEHPEQAPTGPGVMRLSDPALKPDIAKLKEKLRSDPAFALKTLQSAGIATATGKLTKRFKG